jgi:hypothetical protein
VYTYVCKCTLVFIHINQYVHTGPEKHEYRGGGNQLSFPSKITQNITQEKWYDDDDTEPQNIHKIFSQNISESTILQKMRILDTSNLPQNISGIYIYIWIYVQRYFYTRIEICRHI